MGYFVLSLKDTVEDKLEAALKNIELWEDLDNGGEYLISGFVKTLIQDALELNDPKTERTIICKHEKTHYSQRWGEHVCSYCGMSMQT